MVSGASESATRSSQKGPPSPHTRPAQVLEGQPHSWPLGGDVSERAQRASQKRRRSKRRARARVCHHSTVHPKTARDRSVIAKVVLLEAQRRELVRRARTAVAHHHSPPAHVAPAVSQPHRCAGPLQTGGHLLEATKRSPQAHMTHDHGAS